jgi:hypothetical protein
MIQRWSQIGSGACPFYRIEPMPITGWRWRPAKRVPRAVRELAVSIGNWPFEIFYDTRAKTARIAQFWERTTG